MQRKQRRRWWVTWPGALALGGASSILALPGVVALIGTALLPAEDSVGIDIEVSGPGVVARVVCAVLGVAALACPSLTVRWARKKWAGFVLLGLALSAAAGVVGLGMLGIL